MADVERWLQDLGLARYARTFVENDIDLDVLSDLSEQDLEELGVSLGHRKKLFRAKSCVSGATSPNSWATAFWHTSVGHAPMRIQRSGRCARVWRQSRPLADCASRRAMDWQPESGLPPAWSSW